MEELLYEEDVLKGLNIFDWTQKTFDPPLSIQDPGQGLILRPLKRTDFTKGFPKILSQLTTLGEVTEERFLDAFDKMKNAGDIYYVTVIEDIELGKIVGSATLLVEQKFIHACAKRARIEDVVVSDAYRGKQLGKLLIVTMGALGKALGCYKISLDCRDAMLGFYESLGFNREEGNSNFMVCRYE